MHGLLIHPNLGRFRSTWYVPSPTSTPTSSTPHALTGPQWPQTSKIPSPRRPPTSPPCRPHPCTPQKSFTQDSRPSPSRTASWSRYRSSSCPHAAAAHGKSPRARCSACRRRRVRKLVRLSLPYSRAPHRTISSTPRLSLQGDLNVFNATNPRERFWAARTRQLQSSHVSEGDRLWSNLPYMRPLCGVVDDGCEVGSVGREARRDERGGVTRWGGRCHDLLGTRCDPYGV